MGQNISKNVDSARPRRRRVQNECCIDFGELEGAALPMSMPQRLSRREVLREREREYARFVALCVPTSEGAPTMPDTPSPPKPEPQVPPPTPEPPEPSIPPGIPGISEPLNIPPSGPPGIG